MQYLVLFKIVVLYILLLRPLLHLCNLFFSIYAWIYFSPLRIRQGLGNFWMHVSETVLKLKWKQILSNWLYSYIPMPSRGKSPISNHDYFRFLSGQSKRQFLYHQIWSNLLYRDENISWDSAKKEASIGNC